MTGLAAITPLGNNAEIFWQGLTSCESGARAISLFEPKDHVTRFAAEVRDFQPEDYMARKDIRRTDRFTQFALAASEMAMNDARLKPESVTPHRIGCIIGSCFGGIGTYEKQFDIYRARGALRVSPFFIPMTLIDMAAGEVAIRLGIKGPNYATVSACASSSHAIGNSYHAIQRGDADAMVCGGAEASICGLIVAGLNSLKALSTRNDDPQGASRPFDKTRDGFVMGEGAGIVVLEHLKTAQERGARILAEVTGVGYSDDAYHITAPDKTGEGFARAMSLAMADAGLEPGAIDYINAHGTSTKHNDRIESLAIEKTFAQHAHKVQISSTKSMTGHLIGAAGGVEFVATVQTLRHALIPPTINYETPDEACRLNYVPNKPIEKKIRAAMTNTFGFGGHNTSLIVQQYDTG